MKPQRHWIPFLGVIALIALFLKLPEVPNWWGIFKCKACTADDPYFQLVGAGYFATLTALALLFPLFPHRLIGRAGVVWSIALATLMTYMNRPNWCTACLIAHSCHVAMWAIWLTSPAQPGGTPLAYRKERLYLTLFAPISVVALFSCLNLTFMAYGFKINPNVLTSGLRPGDRAPSFGTDHDSALIINFIAPNCPYCKEQLPIVRSAASQLVEGSCRLINVCSALPPELIQLAPDAEWIQDGGGALRKAFKVAGYPTLFVIGKDGKVKQVIPGVPDQLESSLIASLPRSSL